MEELQQLINRWKQEADELHEEFKECGARHLLEEYHRFTSCIREVKLILPALKQANVKRSFALSSKEIATINSLLQVAEGDWFNADVLPEGVQSVAEANRIVKRLCKIFA